MSVARRLAVGSGLRIFHLAATAVVAFFLTPYIIQTLGDRTYGVWTIVAAFIGYYGLFDLGLGSAVTRYLAKAAGAKNDAEANRIFNTALVVYTVVGLAVLAVTAIAAGFAAYFVKNSADAELFAKLLLILGVNTAVDFGARVFEGVLYAQLRHDLNVISLLVLLGLRTVLTVVVLEAGYAAVGLATVTLISAIPVAWLRMRWARKSFPALRVDLKSAQPSTGKELFSYSSWTLVAQLADLVRFQLDSVIIAAFVSLAAVTHYSIAASLVQYFGALVLATLGVFTPLFSRQQGAGDEATLQRTFAFATKISVAFSVFVGFGLIVWGRPFITRWMGAEYLDAYPVLVVLVLGRVTALGQMPSVGLMYATAQHKFYAWSNSVEAVLNLGFSLWLVQDYGILGVALGTLIPMVVVKTLLQPWWVSRACGVPLRKYVTLVVTTVLKSGLLLLLAWMCSQWGLLPEYKRMIPAAAVATIVYGIGAWLLVLGSNDRKVLKTVVLPAAN